MSRVSDPVKVEQWSERLSRFGESGQTVAEFCRAECVSQPSFYQWKKKLGCPRAKTRSVRTDPADESNSSIESLPSMAWGQISPPPFKHFETRRSRHTPVSHLSRRHVRICGRKSCVIVNLIQNRSRLASSWVMLLDLSLNSNDVFGFA